MGCAPVVPDFDGHLLLRGGTAPRLSPASREYTSGGNQNRQSRQQKTFCDLHTSSSLKIELQAW
jgi:hypothetical protein